MECWNSVRRTGGSTCRYYLTTHASVRADLEQGRARDAWAHYLAIGRAMGLQPALPPEEQITEQQANALFRRKADNLLPMVGRVPLDFTCTGVASVSVILVLHDRFPQTLMVLAALRAQVRRRHRTGADRYRVQR